MSKTVKTKEITSSDAGRTLLSYLKALLPVPYPALQKMMRTGQIRLQGKRVKGTEILQAGDQLRLPPYDEQSRPRDQIPPSKDEILEIQKQILYEDDDLLVLNKPFGLAVQGGTGTKRHLDRMVQVFAKEEPLRITHRLDKDTSGVIVFAKNYASAREMTSYFKEGKVEKEYLAVAVGTVVPCSGLLDAPISKRPGRGGERMELDSNGLSAVTSYDVLEERKDLTFLRLKPRTGRTHQLRVHCADLLKAPILGDGKYGGKAAHPRGREKLHLHAFSLKVKFKDRVLCFKAPLPEHMKKTLKDFQFSSKEHLLLP